MTKDEALKLVLEELENVYWATESDLTPMNNAKECAEAVAIIKEALAQPQQKPVAWWHQKSDTFTSGSLVSNFTEWKPLYTTPPQRKPLTDEEMKLLWAKHGYKSAMCKPFARAIEAAHGIKENT